MKKVTLISLMAVAVLGLMTSRAWSQQWGAKVNIVNSGETPVQLSLENNEPAKAAFPDGGTTCILQPAQSTVLYSDEGDSTTDTLQWNIIYNFYDGTDIINQRISCPGNSCASPSTSASGLFSVSEGIFVSTTWADVDVGANLASSMGLSGTGETVVTCLIDALLGVCGYNPARTETSVVSYSITIGQSDYNIDKLAGVDWSSFSVSTPIPPPVTFIKGQQIYQYNPASNAWLSSQNLPLTATIADFAGANVSIGLQDGWIAKYGVVVGDPQILNYIYNGLPNYDVAQISRNPNGPQFMAAFADSSVWYSDGTSMSKIGNLGSGIGILQMCVNWNAGAGVPQTLIGMANGAVQYLNGNAWNNLPDIGSGTSIMQLNAYWDHDNNLQAVAGLGDGMVFYWTGSSWTCLYTASGDAPVYQLWASFQDGGTYPQVLATLLDGSIVYYNPVNYTASVIRPVDNNYCIIDVQPPVAYTPNSPPTFLAGFSDGSVKLYDGVAPWVNLQPATGNRVQFVSADWSIFNVYTGTLAYVYCCNYQFCFSLLGWASPTPYPAIPCVSSACGDIDEDGLDDLVSIEGSNWYTWLSSSQYSTRGGPYNLGVSGKPATGDIDGDGRDDLLGVLGTNWYAWTASSGYTQRIGPFGLGVGKPLAGDVDGDGQDDLIMVNGSLWYAWTAASGYTQRISLFDPGIRGLPAVGDIDGDGLVDLFVVVGSKWYVWFSASQYSTHRSYNMGVSGAPATGDLDGDGLADLIVIVGSDWYVWFSTSQYQVPCGPFTMSVL